jgi:hypothetical protein
MYELGIINAVQLYLNMDTDLSSSHLIDAT